MAPSVLRLGAAALACASSTLAVETYQLKESYNPSNFFDKFTFFSSPDPNQGFVKYRSKQDATNLGLIQSTKDEVTIKVDSTGTDKDGRSSVRIESVNTYNSGLFIADFSHFPKPACGAWPAYWMVGPQWPLDGEVDIYEGWNLNTANKVVLHTDGPSVVGSCTVSQEDFTASLRYSNCWDKAPDQPGNTGCAADEPDGTFGGAAGGVYATEWSETGFKIWSWTHDNVPSDVKSGKPDPSTWGMPVFAAGGSTCDVTKTFNNMRIILNINLCGDAAGGLWGETCQAATGVAQCAQYVQQNPKAFEQTYWKIRGIDVYQLETVKPSSTAASSTSTTSSKSSTSNTSAASSTSTSDSTPSSTSTKSTKSTAPTSTTGASTSATETCTSDVTTESATETVTSTSSSGPATETDTESDCPDDNTPSTTFPPDVTGTSGTATATASVSATETATETESECSDDISETATVGPTDSSTKVTATAAPTDSFTEVTATASTTEFTTSTIYSTVTSTITSCAPTVTNCPARTVTSVIVIGTTVCPVTEVKPTETGGGVPGTGVPSASAPGAGSPSADVPSSNVPGTGVVPTSSVPTVSVPAPGGPIGGDTTLRTSTTVYRTTTVVVPRPTDGSAGGGDNDNNNNNNNNEEEGSGDNNETASSSTLAPSFVSPPASSSAIPDEPEQAQPTDTGAGVPPVEIVTSTSPSATSSGLSPVVTAGAGKVAARSAVLMGVGAVVALVNL
ncbi:glycoside hydrolase family 16 protein [Thermothelomyces thermophilus ATCC 42464]|uniref:Glycoside hydrolase family 16 protein n=1 Tax=Thermothelomyces thermophilus (strain ATCC 42464 / BCRC 31852 / DSM 1799) TaxID=573729 RepID=G2QB45_THET4|nr:glycoside hydrolase family 16 protein [Thermothelomyces thermophilus ATCC 42464]AEO55983.1 glycoside hydrolase family 16 protein [Thermothelomyces thermophilus ATCC 42464]